MLSLGASSAMASIIAGYTVIVSARFPASAIASPSASSPAR
jgi:hypothetical protein